jgi:hypothetical protein
LVDEVIAVSYPKLSAIPIRIEVLKSDADYFRTRFRISSFFLGRSMVYVLKVNPKLFQLDAPAPGIRAIIAHELAHIAYYHNRNRVRLLGLVRLVSKGFTAKWERWTDLQAISRGYGPGLMEYRAWLYRNVPARNLAEKKRDYFSPEEIAAIETALKTRPALLEYWLNHVPRNLNQIEHPPKAAAAAGRGPTLHLTLRGQQRRSRVGLLNDRRPLSRRFFSL